MTPGGGKAEQKQRSSTDGSAHRRESRREVPLEGMESVSGELLSPAKILHIPTSRNESRLPISPKPPRLKRNKAHPSVVIVPGYYSFSRSKGRQRFLPFASAVWNLDHYSFSSSHRVVCLCQ